MKASSAGFHFTVSPQYHKQFPSVGGTSVGAQGIAPLSWCKIAVPHETGKRYKSVAILTKPAEAAKIYLHHRAKKRKNKSICKS